MIYMRDKKDKKKSQQHLVKRLILDQIKHKITENGVLDTPHRSDCWKKHKKDALGKQTSPVLYQISCHGNRNSQNINISSEKMGQQVAISDISQPICSHFCAKRRSILNIQKCFDVQVVNLMDSHQQIETCMKLVQKYKEQTSRLSVQNQHLISMLADMEKSRQKYYSILTTRREEEKQHIAYDSFCQTEGQKLSSVQKIQGQRSPLDALDKIQQSHQFLEGQYWKQELNARESRIKNLQIEKEYMSDQMLALEKDLDELHKVFAEVSAERNKAENEVKTWKIKCQRLQKELQINKVQLDVVTDQIQLQKSRIRNLQEKVISSPINRTPTSNPIKSRYVQIPDTNKNVTIQTVLKFLKQKELIRYHEALMQLINKYQYQMSELKINYMQQRQMRDRFLKYSQKIYSMILPQNNVSYQQISIAISKYEEEIKYLKENQIDILLRKVKSLSIGINQEEFCNIKIQLEEYVYQLQARLPALSEEYFQDGSSVNDSHHASLEI